MQLACLAGCVNGEGGWSERTDRLLHATICRQQSHDARKRARRENKHAAHLDKLNAAGPGPGDFSAAHVFYCGNDDYGKYWCDKAHQHDGYQGESGWVGDLMPAWFGDEYFNTQVRWHSCMPYDILDTKDKAVAACKAAEQCTRPAVAEGFKRVDFDKSSWTSLWDYIQDESQATADLVAAVQAHVRLWGSAVTRFNVRVAVHTQAHLICFVFFPARAHLAINCPAIYQT